MKRPKRLDTSDLVERIEKLARERIQREKVVDIQGLRQLKALKKTILIIEDDETMRMALSRIFEDYRVIAASDGTQLSQVLDGGPIDLIILDVGLPWIDGYELAGLMKGHKDLKSIPIVFVSGRNHQEDVKRGFSVGADDFITKPFNVEHLKKSVQTLLELRG